LVSSTSASGLPDSLRLSRAWTSATVTSAQPYWVLLFARRRPCSRRRLRTGEEPKPHLLPYDFPAPPRGMRSRIIHSSCKQSLSLQRKAGNFLPRQPGRVPEASHPRLRPARRSHGGAEHVA
jgi:hypothetical protein